MVDIKRPLPELSKKFIALMDSQRGLQAKLSKAIGKKAASFSAIKQGKPVNADHLKAVGLVCGPEKLLAILSIGKNSDHDDQDESHELTIKRFKQKELAQKLCWNSLKLEKINPEALEEVNDFIQFKIGVHDSRLSQRRKQDDPDQIPEGGDRRSGKDRRQSSAGR